MANKVKFGLKNTYYAVATIDETDNTATYAAPVKMNGAVSLSMEAQGDTNKFYADDGVYFASVANNGFEGDLEMALIPDSFRKDILGEVEDKNKVLVDDTNASQVQFALLFEFQGDKKAKRHAFFNCVATRPAVASATKGESVEPQTETLTITASPIHCAALNTDITKANCESDNTAYDTWFTEVYTPVAPDPVP